MRIKKVPIIWGMWLYVKYCTIMYAITLTLLIQPVPAFAKSSFVHVNIVTYSHAYGSQVLCNANYSRKDRRQFSLALDSNPSLLQNCLLLSNEKRRVNVIGHYWSLRQLYSLIIYSRTMGLTPFHLFTDYYSACSHQNCKKILVLPKFWNCNWGNVEHLVYS